MRKMTRWLPIVLLTLSVALMSLSLVSCTSGSGDQRPQKIQDDIPPTIYPIKN